MGVLISVEQRAAALVAARTDERRILTALASLDQAGLDEDVCPSVAWLREYERFTGQLVAALESPHPEYSAALVSLSASPEVMARLALQPRTTIEAVDGPLSLSAGIDVRLDASGRLQAFVPYEYLAAADDPFAHYSIELRVVKGRRGRPASAFVGSCRWAGSLPQGLRDVVGWGGPDERLTLATLVMPPE